MLSHIIVVSCTASLEKIFQIFTKIRTISRAVGLGRTVEGRLQHSGVELNNLSRSPGLRNSAKHEHNNETGAGTNGPIL